MLAWYLLKEGQREAGEAFSQLQAERGEDFGLLLTIGNARLDSGDGSGALDAFDHALAMAKQSDDPDVIYEARAERRGCREEMHQNLMTMTSRSAEWRLDRRMKPTGRWHGSRATRSRLR